MELSLKQTEVTKGIAILMMLSVHLFNQPYEGLFEPLVFIGSTPLSFYISLAGDCCLPIYSFCAGYGLYVGYTKDRETYSRKNYIRILKLYTNYWIILLLFAVLLGLLLGKTGYPGSLWKFLVNFTALDNTYNGAWWFFLTYVLLALTSPVIFRIIEKYNVVLIVATVFTIYVLCYVQRRIATIVFDSEFLDWGLSRIVSYGYCLLPFVIGALSYKHKLYSRFTATIAPLKFKNLLLLTTIVLSVVFRGFFPTTSVAVFTGIVFIFCFNALTMPEKLGDALRFLSGHSTNLWLIHMFFYATYFREMIYAPQNPTLIFTWLLLWTLAASFVVNFIYKPILKISDAKFSIS